MDEWTLKGVVESENGFIATVTNGVKEERAFGNTEEKAKYRAFKYAQNESLTKGGSWMSNIY